MKLSELQKKYPRFVYRNYSWILKNGILSASFDFLIEPDVEFHPRVEIFGVSLGQPERVGKNSIDNLVFNLGLAEIPSYWKATCSRKIRIECGYLDARQRRFWEDLFINGMGQFFFENKLAFFSPRFEIAPPKPKVFPQPFIKRISTDFLVPVGGGKDALVTYEAVKSAKKNITAFVLNENAPLKRLIEAMGVQNISVKRTFDSKLFELNGRGYLNGHTPFSSYLAFLSALLAVLFDKKYIAISQERSSGEGNVEYLGRTINHQYSKSPDFENKFRKYSQKYLAENLEFFSAIRPLYEIQIARIFSRYKQYFPYFLSCNKPYRITDRSVASWCGACPKCLFTFAALYPFVGKAEAKKIFGRDLFEDESLVPLMDELAGEAKPFECVGTRLETIAAFYLSLKIEKDNPDLPPLLEHFKNNILPGFPDIEKQTQKILASWDKKNNLPDFLAKILHRNDR
jgi:hypothetical protein